jgi:hypothetical protein
MSVLECALAYREQGFAVLSLDGKRPHTPLIVRTHGGPRAGSVKRLAKAVVSDDHVRAWFCDPRVNVGIFCGEPSGGLVVVDLDGCPLPPKGVRLPLTSTVKTGRDRVRGHHLYYRTERPVPSQAFSWGEVRGYSEQGGAPVQVVAPPSRHPDTGLAYGWQLTPDEVGLASYDGVHLGELAVETASSINPLPPNQEPLLRTTKAVLLRPGTTADTGEEWWRSYARDERVVALSARALGIDAPLGRPFRCVLHPEAHASASLHRAEETSEWLYHDFHHGRHGGGEWLTLPQVRALQAGRVLPLGASEHATWALILYVEAGVLAAQAVPARPLPASVDPVARHVYERFVFLLACRWNYHHGQPAPLERGFTGCLCTLPERVARQAIDYLHRYGHIYIAGRHGRTRLWLPAGVPPPSPNGGPPE